MRIIACVILCCVVLSCDAVRCHNKASKRAQSAPPLKWPNNVVPFEISKQYDADEKQLILNSLKELTRLTGDCVKFVPRTSSHPNWVRVISSDGCWSPLGMQKKKGFQELSLDQNGCMIEGTVIHEFMHALGFDHEQTRPDRGNYVKLLYQNIEPDNKHNYDMNPDSGPRSYGLPYDFMSIMHYEFSDFSTNCLPIMVPIAKESKRWRFKMGTAIKMSSSDITRIKKLYNCV